MNFLELAKERYSVRKYKSEQITDQELKKILDAGKFAPTAVNYQPQKIYVLKSEEEVQKMAGLTKCTFGAPMVILLAYDKERAWTNPLSGDCSGREDIGIVATHMVLEAWELGIGTCLVEHFNPDDVSKAFDLPEQEEPVMIIPIGYLAEDAKPIEKLHFSYRDDADMIRVL